MRQPLAAVVALLVASIGAVILGEYDLHGVTALAAGAIFGAAIGEVVTWVGRSSATAMRAAAATSAGAGLLWATWISMGHALRYATVSTWLGIVLGVAVAALWVRSAGRRAAHIPDDAAQGLDTPDRPRPAP